VIHKLINHKGEDVGFYQPSRPKAALSGVVELTTDYRGISHNIISSWFSNDKNIATIRTNNNPAWMKDYLNREGHGLGWGDPITVPNPEDYGTYYTLAEVCSKFRVSERTIYNWMEKGRLNSVRVGKGKHLFVKAEVDRLAR